MFTLIGALIGLVLDILLILTLAVFLISLPFLLLAKIIRSFRKDEIIISNHSGVHNE